MIQLFLCLIAISYNLTAKELSYQDYLKQVYENDPLIKSYKLEIKSSQHAINQQLPTNQYLFSLEEERGYSISGADFNTRYTTGRLSKEIIDSGTSIGLQHNETTRPDRSEKVTEVRVDQSLLRNSFGRDTRLKRKSLETQYKAKKIEVDELIETRLATRLKQYLDYQRAYLELDLARNILNEVNSLYQVIDDRYKKRVATKTDLNRGKLLRIDRTEEVIAKKNNFIEAKSQTLNGLGEDQLHLKSINPPKDLSLYKKLIEVEKSSKKIDFETSRDYRRLQMKLESSKDELTLAQRLQSLDLNFFGGYSRDNSNRFNARINREEVFAGLRLEIPFGDDQSQATEQIARVVLDNDQITAKTQKESFVNNKAFIATQINELKEYVKIRAEKVEVTKEIIKDEQRRYEIGRYELENLIDLKNNYASYRNDFVLSQIELSKKIIDWLDLNDSLKSFVEQEVLK